MGGAGGRGDGEKDKWGTRTGTGARRDGGRVGGGWERVGGGGRGEEGESWGAGGGRGEGCTGVSNAPCRRTEGGDGGARGGGAHASCDGVEA